LLFDEEKSKDSERVKISPVKIFYPKGNQESFSSSNAIYFNFNEVALTADDYAALNKIVANK